ncbi:mitochondrial carrier protein [Morchella conica CCBAS932]|uniref:Mitochondrial carrier protein n=1 Tax=Morchella conica CCBAS932 TaxID=1392247 RepID=A0A3N4L5C3_9PEZI|nr:mitochondrial carrier protein [Morchella conica CCBAS932]
MADFWAGYISGAASIIIGSPLDIIKVRLQSGPLNISPTAQTYSFENLGSLVRGAAAPLVGYGALNALLFVSYNRTLELLGDTPANPSSLWKIWVAGAAGGLATFCVNSPTDLVKCRAQLSASGESSWSITKQILRSQGIRGLYFGGVVTSLRDSIGYGFYFLPYQYIQKVLDGNFDMSDHYAFKILLSGGLAGCISWASIYPLDLVKTRYQTQFTASEAPLLPNQNRSAAPMGAEMSTWECAKAAYREGGRKIFFNGLGICMARAFLVNAAGFFVYEWALAQLQPSRSRGYGSDSMGVGA